MVNMYYTFYVHIRRQRVESLILSSQISTNLQRVFLDGDTIQLTFNLGMVMPKVYNICIQYSSI